MNKLKNAIKDFFCHDYYIFWEDLNIFGKVVFYLPLLIFSFCCLFFMVFMTAPTAFVVLAAMVIRDLIVLAITKKGAYSYETVEAARFFIKVWKQ